MKDTKDEKDGKKEMKKNNFTLNCKKMNCTKDVVLNHQLNMKNKKKNRFTKVVSQIVKTVADLESPLRYVCLFVNQFVLMHKLIKSSGNYKAMIGSQLLW